MDQEGLTIWTIGHSTRSVEEFMKILNAQRIETVAVILPGRTLRFARMPITWRLMLVRRALKGCCRGYCTMRHPKVTS